MANSKQIAIIVQKIVASRKYKTLYLPTIERIVADCLHKYDAKTAEKKARNLLHQIWGAYYGSRPNFSKQLKKLSAAVNNNADPKQLLLSELALQSSSQERITILDEFYQNIFAITGKPKSIIDHGCALNPLAIYWMNLPDDCVYNAYDIDTEQLDFIQGVYDLLPPNCQTTLTPSDILVDEFPPADMVFILKMLPCLEQQQKGISRFILEKQRCNYLVVSFPVKSIGGKEKGMADFYKQQFKLLLAALDWNYQELSFVSELVFIINKN